MIRNLSAWVLAACFPVLQGCVAAVKPPAQAGDEMEEYALFDDDRDLGSYSGKKVILQGTLSDIPWQHLINVPETHPEISYLNTAGGGQTVLYSRGPIRCHRKVRVKGAVVEVRGKSKRPDSKEQYLEYQVIVDTWDCLD